MKTLLGFSSWRPPRLRRIIGPAPKTEKPAPPVGGRGGAQAPPPPLRPHRRAGPGAAPAPSPPAGSLVQGPKYPPLRHPGADAAAFTLSNGMRFYLLEDHDLPLVSGIALVRTGNLFDPPERIGLAQLAGMVHAHRRHQQPRPANRSTPAGEYRRHHRNRDRRNRRHGVLLRLKENAAVTLQLFKEVLTQPGFPPGQDRSRQDPVAQRHLAPQRRRRGIAEREFADLIYGKDTPYGWQLEYATSTASRAPTCTRSTSATFSRPTSCWRWGDFDTAEMKAPLEKLFADWTGSSRPSPNSRR